MSNIYIYYVSVCVCVWGGGGGGGGTRHWHKRWGNDEECIDVTMEQVGLK